MSSNNININNNNNNNFIEIKNSLNQIFTKIKNSNSKENGYNLFKNLINNHIYNKTNINFIFSTIKDYIDQNIISEKEEIKNFLKIFSIFLSNNNNNKNEDFIDKHIYYQYVSTILNLLQKFINEDNIDLFQNIVDIFDDIIQELMPTNIEATNCELEPDEKRCYELLQNFCFLNIQNKTDNSCQLFGSLCLTKLVENCPIVLKEQYLSFIWQNIIAILEDKNFIAKTEILNCLISLILGAEVLFIPYANVTLYKVLDFLTDFDWLKRKLSLNIVYTLIFYCREEIIPLKENIINFLKILENDKVKEVRDVCYMIIQNLNENNHFKDKDSDNKN